MTCHVFVKNLHFCMRSKMNEWMPLFRFSFCLPKSLKLPIKNGSHLWNITVSRLKEQGLGNEVDNHSAPLSLKLFALTEGLIYASMYLEKTNLKRCMHPSVHCSTIYSSKDMEATQMSIHRWIDKEDVYTHTYVYI